MRKVSRPLAEALEYLRDVGYGDLHREVVAASAGASASDIAIADNEGMGPSTPPDPAEAAERRAALEDVAREAAGCEKCRLAEGRHTVVFGVGNPDADLMFVGEGPGAEEDRQGLPFVGPAGELLTKIIRAIELEREDVYIANVVKCRPPRNRDPQPDESEACRPYLERQIDLVRPRVLVALGRVAAQNLLQLNSPLGRMRGRAAAQRRLQAPDVGGHADRA